MTASDVMAGCFSSGVCQEPSASCCRARNSSPRSMLFSRRSFLGSWARTLPAATSATMAIASSCFMMLLLARRPRRFRQAFEVSADHLGVFLAEAGADILQHLRLEFTGQLAPRLALKRLKLAVLGRRAGERTGDRRRRRRRVARGARQHARGLLGGLLTCFLQALGGGL